MKGFAKGLAFLTIAALFVKVLSMFYRIPFQNLVGDQGFFIYQQVYPFIAIFMTWTASGLAIAISKLLVDEFSQSIQRQNAVATLLYRTLWFVSISLFILMYFASNFFAQEMGDEQLESLLKISAFVVLTVPILSMYKGKLQAKSDLKSVAIIQVIEQVTRVVFILGGTAYVMSNTGSLYKAGEMAVLGTVLGEVVGAVLLVIYMKRNKGNIKLFSNKSIEIEKKPILTKLLVVSISASLSSLLLILFQLVDSFTVFETLETFVEDSIHAMEEKGIYDRGQPLVQVGLVVATSISLAVVPLVASAIVKERSYKVNQLIQFTFQVACLFGIASTIGLILVMPELNTALFENADLSNVLRVYVLQILLLSVIVTITAILQGIGFRKWPTIILSSAFIIKLSSNTYFVHRFGIVGAAWASNIALLFGTMGLIYYLKIVRKIRLAPNRFYFTVLLASLAMSISVILLKYLGDLIQPDFIEARAWAVVSLVCSSTIGATVFILCITKLEIFQEEEWLNIPFGSKIAKIQLLLNRN